MNWTGFLFTVASCWHEVDAELTSKLLWHKWQFQPWIFLFIMNLLHYQLIMSAPVKPVCSDLTGIGHNCVVIKYFTTRNNGMWISGSVGSLKKIVGSATVENQPQTGGLLASDRPKVPDAGSQSPGNHSEKTRLDWNFRIELNCRRLRVGSRLVGHYKPTDTLTPSILEVLRQ